MSDDSGGMVTETWQESLARAYLGLPRDEAVRPEHVRAWRAHMQVGADLLRGREQP